MINDLFERFDWPVADAKSVAVVNNILDNALELAQIIDISLPDGREKSLAITKLEECCHWAGRAGMGATRARGAS